MLRFIVNDKNDSNEEIIKGIFYLYEKSKVINQSGLYLNKVINYSNLKVITTVIDTT
jgi:hypothetical protein